MFGEAYETFGVSRRNDWKQWIQKASYTGLPRGKSPGEKCILMKHVGWLPAISLETSSQLRVKSAWGMQRRNPWH